MFDVHALFEEAKELSAPTFDELWNKREQMERWFESVFDAILATPTQKFSLIDVPPYKFRHDATNLFSVSFLSFFNARPEKAEVRSQDIEHIFCDVFLDYFDFKDGEAEQFFSWISATILRAPEEDEYLDEATSDFIREHLLYKSRSDPQFSRLGMMDKASFIPLFVSTIFTIHIGELWPQLLDRIDSRESPELKLPFKLIEMFLNRFAEEQLRFRTITADHVKEAMRLKEHSRAAHPELAPSEETVLCALRFGSGPEVPTRTRRTRSVARQDVNRRRRRFPGSVERAATKMKKRAENVPQELHDVA